MEKTFAKATLFSATVLVVFMVMVPINHLSAQSEVKIDEKAKLRKVTVDDMHLDTNTLIVDIDGAKVTVVLDASTTVFLGNGESPMKRRSLSRAQLSGTERSLTLNPTLDVLGLSAR